MNLPCRKTMCATCPFQEGSKYAFLKEGLIERGLSESRICHSTGKNNGINKRTGKEEHLCRGVRNFQLKLMSAAGVIGASTDEAWNEERVRIGMEPILIQDP